MFIEIPLNVNPDPDVGRMAPTPPRLQRVGRLALVCDEVRGLPWEEREDAGITKTKDRKKIPSDN